MNRRSYALAAVCAVLFLTFLDNTIVSVALADLQTSLSAGVSSLQWIVDGYMLAFAGLMLTGGTLGDLFGRKRLLLAGVALFFAGALVGALAQSTSMLIVGRVVMGVGAAASEPGTLSLLRHIYPESRERARALGVWTAVSGVSLALGPVLGGILVAAAGWRGIFWFNVAFAAAAFAAAARFVPESSNPEGRKLDLPGLETGAAAIIGVTFATIDGENVGYGTWWIVALYAVSALAVVMFVIAERRSPDPVLRLEFFRVPAFSAATVVGFATSFGLFAVFFFTALYLQIVAHFSGWRIALQFVAMALAMVVGGRLAGVWTGARGPRLSLTAGCAIAGGSMFGVDALLSPHVGFTLLAIALAGVGLGLGLALVGATAAVLGIVPPERSGMAASTVNTARQLGGVLAVAVLGSVVNAQILHRLGPQLVKLGVPPIFQSIVVDAVTHGGLPANAKQAAAANPIIGAHASLVEKVLHAATADFGHGLHIVLVIAALMLLGGAVAGAFAGGVRETRPSDEPLREAALPTSQS
jgi:EmrB/QacA subfamily drug resistance transporter